MSVSCSRQPAGPNLSDAFASLSWATARLMLLLLASSCGSSDAVYISAPPAHLGQLEVGLVAPGSAATLFRLRDAILTLQGQELTLFLDSERDPKQAVLNAALPPGVYEAFLQEGWSLERINDGTKPANARLLSPNPAFFVISEGQITRLPLRFRVDAEDLVTDPGLLQVVLEVEEAPPAPAVCADDLQCSAGQVCCIAGLVGSCLTLEPGAACPLPDLTISAESALASLSVKSEFFALDSCAVKEACVAHPGQRRLLRFSTTTPNIGEIDLVLGDPASGKGFEYGACHGHYHFTGYARYELLDSTGSVVADGRKQAFCLLDSEPVGLPGAAATPRYHCGFQGLQRGWADTYADNLDCQWLDVTDVPDGQYSLRLSVNPDRILPESDFSNNVVEIPVTIAEPPPLDPLMACSAPEAGLRRECGWVFADGFSGTSCTPGELLRVGCGCPDADCEGDPMLRACDGSEACSASAALTQADESCGHCPEVTFPCPPSGAFSVLSSSFNLQPYTCSVVAEANPPM
jgi:hypothetical protein